MKNKIEDLRNHLFAQLERLSDDEEMKNPIKLDKELKRAKAISEVSSVIVNSAKAETDFIKAIGATKPVSDFIPSNPVKQIEDGKK